MTEDAAPDTNTAVPAKHKIVAGAALIAVLSGAGISALDTAWWNGSDGRVARNHTTKPPVATPAPMPRLAAQPASVAATAPPTAPTATRSVVEVRPTLRRTKRKTRPAPAIAPTTTAAPAPATTTSIASGATIDAQYEAMTALQCAKGISGFFCREEIRWRLCKGRWSDGIQPGASRCHVEKAETAAR